MDEAAVVELSGREEVNEKMELEKLKVEYTEFRRTKGELIKDLVSDDERTNLKAELIAFGSWMCQKDLGKHRAGVGLPEFSFDKSEATRIAATSREGIVVNVEGLKDDSINSTTKLKIFNEVSSKELGLLIDDGLALKYIMVGVEEFGHWFFMNSKNEETVKAAEKGYVALTTFASFTKFPDLTMHLPRFEYESLMIQDWFIRKHLPSFEGKFGDFVGRVMGVKYKKINNSIW